MKPILKTSLMCALSFLMMACTATKVQIANLPSRFNDMKETKDVKYGYGKPQKLDIYEPANSEGKTLPVIVYFYGGDYSNGDKSQYLFMAKRLTDAGFIVVIPNYSKYPDVKFPTFIEDAAVALAWVNENISVHNGDIKNIFVLGHSSGAHMGALVTADEHYLKDAGSSTKIIKAFAGLAGPYDFVPDNEKYKVIFGPESNYKNMHVSTFIDGKEPPMLLIWGEKDDLVGRQNIDILSKKLDEKGGDAKIIILKDATHVSLVASFSWLGGHNNNVAEDVIRFFKERIN